ncbi:MAG: serine/threonine protein kinase [Bdellovibrionales bacterium]|nr:serine/threonine protein kinase [Bdellovibrionales bacterium]
MAFKPHQFGRYVIVDPIAVGGMAEIYRARRASAGDGADRIIVIKKVIANLSNNPEFVEMFEEEIKITVGLTNPHIIQIYDYGKVGGQYFMAMEYVEGKNLRQFVKRLADMKSMFSIDMSSHIISQVCHALAYAHNFKDRLTGKNLGIVHRDISPQNVMISYDGAVKLFDFGIAKAKTANENTQAGVIKGKPSYLSPEQINGEELDGRSDIFALGIVLWELLTAKRLFVSDNDVAVLKMIQSAKIEPPSTYNPAVPQQLDAIVLKSLARDKTKRYQTAEEYQRDLHKFLYSFNPGFNPADLSYYAQELFKNEIKEDRERLMKYLALPVEPGPGEEAEESAGKKKKPVGNTKLADGLVTSTDFNAQMMEGMLTGTVSAAPEVEQIKDPTKKIQANTGTGIKIEPPTPSGTPPNVGFKVDRAQVPKAKPGASGTVIPPWAKGMSGSSKTGTSAIQLQKAMKEQGNSSKNGLILVAVFAAVLTFAYMGGYLDFFLKGKQAAAPTATQQAAAPTEAAPSEAQRAPASADLGTILIRANVTDFTVRVNGTQVPVAGGAVKVPLHQDLVVVVSKAQHKPATFNARVTGVQPVAYNVSLQSVPSGTLTFLTTPDARLTFVHESGETFQPNTPVKDTSIPAGSYRIRIENDLLGYASEMDLVVEQGKLTRIEKALK